MKNKLSYCGETVRNNDRDRFLLSLAAPREKRAALWALFAFNHEIAKTREVVCEPQLGHIRLQWWKEAVVGIYQGNIMRHDVVEALASAIAENGLPQDSFQALIDARAFDMEAKAPATFMELEMYADQTATPLNRLALKILGQQEDEKTIRAVSVGYALTGLVRAAPFHAVQGRAYLPKGEKDAQAVVVLAEKYLSSAAAAGRHLRLSKDLSGNYLKRIRRLRYNLSDRRMGYIPVLLALRVSAGFYK